MPNARRQGEAAVTVATLADGDVVERPDALVDIPRRLAVRSAVGVRIVAGGERENNGGDANKARLAAAAAADAATAVVLAPPSLPEQHDDEPPRD